jgi:hypothetical protein
VNQVFFVAFLQGSPLLVSDFQTLQFFVVLTLPAFLITAQDLVVLKAFIRTLDFGMFVET